MELELRQETVRCWESVCRTTLEQEETSEMIVPDACPDIWQVLDGEGRLLLQRKEPQDGKAELAGLLKVTILYQPEGENGVRALDLTLPFAASPDLNQVTRRCCLHVRPRVLMVDVHLLNPRKVLVRVGYSLELEAFAPQDMALACMVEDAADHAIRQRTGAWKSLMSVLAQEKSFTYSDTLVLPAGRPDAAQVLRTRAEASCSDARVIGNKLVFKGEAILHILCRGEDGQVFPADFHLPYSQIMDAGEEGEDSLCTLDLAFTDVKCALVEGDPRSFQVELAIQAQAVLRKQIEVPILADLYSTEYDLQTEERSTIAAILAGQGEEQETARESLETTEAPVEILDVQVRLGRAGQSQEGEDRVLTQEAELSVLYRAEEGPASVRRTVTVAHRLPGQGEAACVFTAELPREATASNSGNAIEVSFPLTFHWMSLHTQTVPVIAKVQVGEPLEQTDRRPSAVIRAVKPGQTLWDVAKACRSTEGEIMEASALASAEIYPGQMLLIPR